MLTFVVTIKTKKIKLESGIIKGLKVFLIKENCSGLFHPRIP